MIRAAFERFGAWWIATGWPQLQRLLSYLGTLIYTWLEALFHDPVMHFVTAIATCVLMLAVKLSWKVLG